MEILDDTYLAQRLASQPEFLLKLHEFVAAYGLAERPALVLQARAVQEAAGFIFTEAAAQQRFIDGVQGNNRWWNGLRSRTGATPTFSGVASLGSRERPDWASELHRDGCFIAGVWVFPSLPRNHEGGVLTTITNFYAGIFSDFLTVFNNVVAAGVRFHATATLVNASKLHFSTTPDSWGDRILRGPTSLPNLQWPIVTGSTGTEWEAAASQLAAPLLGACGISSPKSA